MATVTVGLPGCLPQAVWLIDSDDPTIMCNALAEEVEADWDSHVESAHTRGVVEDCAACEEYLDAHTAIHNGATSVHANGLVYEVSPDLDNDDNEEE